MFESLRAFKYSESRHKRRIHAVLATCWHLLRCMVDARLRSEVLATRIYGDRAHQRYTYTESDRYPELFAACRLYFSDRPGVAILSFGCSTGEEVVSLRQYLPQAQITGVDINRWCLRQCRKRVSDRHTQFLHRHSARFVDGGRFDAIFCMAVFQNPDNRNAADNSRATHYTFDRFENEIRFLDSKLKPGGLLIIDHTDFDFTATACSDCYVPLGFEHNRVCHDRPLYDRSNSKVAEQQELYRVFVKKTDQPELPVAAKPPCRA